MFDLKIDNQSTRMQYFIKHVFTNQYTKFRSISIYVFYCFYYRFFCFPYRRHNKQKLYWTIYKFYSAIHILTYIIDIDVRMLYSIDLFCLVIPCSYFCAHSLFMLIVSVWTVWVCVCVWQSALLCLIIVVVNVFIYF